VDKARIPMAVVADLAEAADARALEDTKRRLIVR
jgi:hypothetical protein